MNLNFWHAPFKLLQSHSLRNYKTALFYKSVVSLQHNHCNLLVLYPVEFYPQWKVELSFIQIKSVFSFVYKRHTSLQRSKTSVLIKFCSVISLTNSFSIIARSLYIKHCILNSSMVACNNHVSHQAQWQEVKTGWPGYSGQAWATYQDPDSKINKRKQKLYMKNFTRLSTLLKLGRNSWFSWFQ